MLCIYFYIFSVYEVQSMHLMPDDLISLCIIHANKMQKSSNTKQRFFVSRSHIIAAPITLSSPIRNAITKEAKK